jgi:hypothetical protein|tara:strand:- start:318 stop:458 length:141 start_codon:yes stop_codon:yes gene_type:complete
MAKKAVKAVVWEPVKIKHRTSIGNSPNSRPTNKHKRRSFKKYRGQG